MGLVRYPLSEASVAQLHMDGGSLWREFTVLKGASLK